MGEKFILELANFKHEYGGDITGTIRARRAVVYDDLLTLDEPRYLEKTLHLEDLVEIYEEVHKSWLAGIAYNSELTDNGGRVVRVGLRKPQIGALHAIASHWTLSDEPAMVVMPTGTGKTEVMIAAAVGCSCQRLLVVVPTDALRQQAGDKFEVYGILKQIGIIGSLPFPVIGLLTSKPTYEQFSELAACNVVISTMSSIGLAADAVQRDFASLFSHVFFDEAHHIEAVTWKRFQKHCREIRSLLLTATPFREDGKALDGKIIYNFPLSAAQEEGYFKPIHFVEVFEPDERLSDSRIADAAVSRLREDLGLGHDHILMARAQTINDAKTLYEKIYKPYYNDLNPVLIHSQSKNKRVLLKAIKEGQHKVIVCVDMFGEGFDLPNLKVAALHSVHKSLGITLQFIGRFARTAPDVGSATFVANTADDGVPEALESLYREDADWNLLLPDLSYDAIEPQAKLSELVDNLELVKGGVEEIKISTLALRPKISAQVYRTPEFYPERFQKAFRSNQRILQPQISRLDNILVLIVNQREHIEWTDSRDIVLDNWDLFVAYFDPARKLMYIHSSRKGGFTSQLAKEIAKDPVLIRDEEIFKVFCGLRRLTLYSVGLSSRSRNVRYQMFAGLDVRNAINPVLQQSKLKSNITAVGYEEGERRSVGCSRKGKVWSLRSGSLAQWREWCDVIGAKLSEPNSQPNDFLKYTLVPISVNLLPGCQALMVDWPDQLFESSYFRFEVVTPGKSYGFDDCQLYLDNWKPGSDRFRFGLKAGETVDVVLQIRLRTSDSGEESYEAEILSGENLEIHSAGGSRTITEFFNENPPLVRLADGSQLAGNILLKPQEEISDTYDRTLIQTLDWSDIDIKKESRWRDGAVQQDSVQERLIEYLKEGAAAFIIDDDDTGESADVVAIEETNDTIIVWLWHCKYSSGSEPGHRVADLYEVCGQAQKSVKWTWSLRTLINHLKTREAEHRRGRDTRFIRGSLPELVRLRKSARRKFVTYKIGIVQPGLSRESMPPDHLSIIGSTNSFVQCITDNPLMVVASA
jgi:superfamily II DNA or RNA helicase